MLIPQASTQEYEEESGMESEALDIWDPTEYPLVICYIDIENGHL